MYLAGTTEFYSRVPGNPWQQAHDRLGEEIDKAGKNPAEVDFAQAIEPAVIEFEHQVKLLLDRYRPFSVGAKESPVLTGFYSDTPEQAEVKMSNKDQRCACCLKREDARIAKHPVHGLGVFCPTCLGVEKK